MAIVNLTPLVDELGGAQLANATVRARARRRYGDAIRVSGSSVTFPRSITVTFTDGVQSAPFDLPALPADVYWNIVVEPAVGRGLSVNVASPVTDVDFDELIAVDVSSDIPRPGEALGDAFLDQLAAIRDSFKFAADGTILAVKGADGAPGESAYQVARRNGFAGTEADWLLSLRGAKGDPGQNIFVTPPAFGPQRLGIPTPKTLPRDQKADKDFLSTATTAAAVKTALTDAIAWAQANPTKSVDVLLPDGEIQGSGTGSTSTAWLSNMGDETLARRIRIRPAGGFGYVKIKPSTSLDNLGNVIGTYGIRLLGMKGITLSEIDINHQGILYSGCRNIGAEYLDNVAYAAVLSVSGNVTDDIQFNHMMYRQQRVRNGDGWAISTLSGGAMSNVDWTNIYVAPVRIGPESSWGLDANGKPEKPHSDQMQVKGNALLTNFSQKRSKLAAGYNCITQLGGNTVNYLSEDNILLGGDDMRALFPETRAHYDSLGPATFQVFNGNGSGNHTSRRTYATGNMGSAPFVNTGPDTLTSLSASEVKAGWTKVEPKQLSELAALFTVPEPGTTLWATR